MTPLTHTMTPVLRSTTHHNQLITQHTNIRHQMDAGSNPESIDQHINEYWPLPIPKCSSINRLPPHPIKWTLTHTHTHTHTFPWHWQTLLSHLFCSTPTRENQRQLFCLGSDLVDLHALVTFGGLFSKIKSGTVPLVGSFVHSPTASMVLVHVFESAVVYSTHVKVCSCAFAPALQRQLPLQSRKGVTVTKRSVHVCVRQKNLQPHYGGTQWKAVVFMCVCVCVCVLKNSLVCASQSGDFCLWGSVYPPKSGRVCLLSVCVCVCRYCDRKYVRFLKSSQLATVVFTLCSRNNVVCLWLSGCHGCAWGDGCERWGSCGSQKALAGRLVLVCWLSGGKAKTNSSRSSMRFCELVWRAVVALWMWTLLLRTPLTTKSTSNALSLCVLGVLCGVFCFLVGRPLTPPHHTIPPPNTEPIPAYFMHTMRVCVLACLRLPAEVFTLFEKLTNCHSRVHFMFRKH
jgi:hypothetical protein